MYKGIQLTATHAVHKMLAAKCMLIGLVINQAIWCGVPQGSIRDVLLTIYINDEC